MSTLDDLLKPTKISRVESFHNISSVEKAIGAGHIKPLKLYVSGPMTGYENFNFATFDKATATLRNTGCVVFNPAETPLNPDWQWSDYMRIDIQEVCKADAIYVLPGWQKSKGACIEVAVAFWLNKPVFDYSTGKKFTPVVLLQVAGNESICSEADRLVSTDRQESYGHPIRDFTRTALMFTGFLLDKLKPGKCITPSDIPCLMDLLKLSRCAEKFKRDNYTDIAGYAKTAELVEEARQNPPADIEPWLDILYPPNA